MFYSVAMVLMRCLYHGIEFNGARGVSGFRSKTSQLRISAELESANCLATNISTVRKVSRHFAFGSLEVHYSVYSLESSGKLAAGR